MIKKGVSFEQAKAFVIMLGLKVMSVIERHMEIFPEKLH